MESAAEITAFFQATFVNNCCQLSITALIVYEQLLTISEEVQLLRGRKLSISTVLFLMNRYMLLAFGLINALYVYPWNTALSCEVMSMLYDVLQIVLYAVAAVFSALRAYAINDHDRVSAAITLTLGSVPVAINIFYTAISSYDLVVYVDGSPECNSGNNLSLSTANKLTVTSRISATASDLIVLVITWLRTYKLFKESRRANIKLSLVQLLLRDGTIYFGTLLILNIIQMVLSIRNGPYFGEASEFIAMFPSILISRFLINLNQLQHSRDGSLASGSPSFVQSHSRERSLRFGNSIGESLTDDTLFLSSNEWEPADLNTHGSEDVEMAHSESDNTEGPSKTLATTD